MADGFDDAHWTCKVKRRFLWYFVSLSVCSVFVVGAILWPQPVFSQASATFPDDIPRVKYQSGGSYLMVEVLDDDLVHFELSAFGPGPDASTPIFTTPMIHKTDYPGPSYFSNDGYGNLETSIMRVQIDSSSLCITLTDKTKDPDLTLTRICPWNLDQDWKGLSLTPETFTHAYGLGQQFITTGNANGDWVGRIRSAGDEMGNGLVSWNGGNVANTQFPIVYFAGADNDSYALFLDNVYKQKWDFTGDPWFAKMGGKWIRFYVMTGSDLPDLRKDYMALVGHPPVPPKKAFGLWISEYGYESWSELEDKLSTLREHDFPVDGFVLDLQWFGGISPGSDNTQMGSLTWDLTQFPDPAQKVAALQDDEGIGLIVIEEPYVGKNLPEHGDMESRGYLVRDCETCGATYLDDNPWWGKGGMIDWTYDAGAAYWHDLKREPLIDAGIVGHWTDLGEPEAYNAWAWYWGMIGDHQSLHLQADVHNIYNLKWSQSIYEGYSRNGHSQRPFILSRSGAPGSQRYGVSMWSGDIGSNLSSLATQMNTQFHMSMSGIDYYGADIGGYYRDALDGDQDAMYTQWFANGMAFDVPGRPHAMNQGNYWETAPDRVGDLSSNLENVRQRYTLSPYLYSLAHRAYRYGEAVFPPLVMYYQGDPAVRELGDEKLLGHDLLVAVVTGYGETERSVYLPTGDWVNYHTNAWLHSTGAWFGPFPVYLDDSFTLPMFARAGAIIPEMHVDEETMNILGKRTDGSVRDALILRVYADATPSSFTLYEDDGRTIAYQTGEVRTTELSQQQAGSVVTVTIARAVGTYDGAPVDRDNIVKLVERNWGVATGVTLNGLPLTRTTSITGFESNVMGWMNAGRNLVVAKSGERDIDEAKVFVFYFAYDHRVFLPLILNLG